MSVPGAGLFDDPFAGEIRAEFDAALNAGASAYAAADNIIEKRAHAIHDPDRGPVILYALAALQLQHGVIAAKIRKRVLTWINSGDGLERWRGASPEIYEERKRVEQDLRARLVAMG